MSSPSYPRPLAGEGRVRVRCQPAPHFKPETQFAYYCFVATNFVLLYFKICAACANEFSRQGAKSASLKEKNGNLRMTFIAKLRTLRPSRPFGVAQDMLCGRYSEIWLRLCCARRFVPSFESTVRNDSSERGQRWGSVIPALRLAQDKLQRVSRLTGREQTWIPAWE